MYKRMISRILVLLPLVGLLVAPNAAMGQLSLSAVEVAGAPAGFKTFDFMADISTDMGPMELQVEMYHTGDIFQNAAAPNDPNETYASYVTVGPSGPNVAQTHIAGGAVDLGGAAAATFDSTSIDIAWGPTQGLNTGAGQRQVARLTFLDDAEVSYTLMGWQSGFDDPVTLSGDIAAPMILSMVETPGAPAGYKALDFFADVATDMGPLELLITTDNPGDIFQNATAPDDPNEAFASYVTIGPSGANSALTDIAGGAVDLGGGTAATFDDQNIDIAWAPTTGTKTGRGLMQIARVVVKDTANGSWSLMGLQAGLNADTIYTASGTIGSGPGPLHNRGDVSEDDFVGADDLVRILTNWGASGALVTWAMGDCAPYGDGSDPGDDFIGADDYVEVLTFWGTNYAPEPAPEPATLALFAAGVIASLTRRRRRLA